jgi:hypothetical protein
MRIFSKKSPSSARDEFVSRREKSGSKMSVYKVSLFPA